MRKAKKIFGDKKPNPGLIAIEVVYNSIGEMAKGHLRYSQDLVKYVLSVSNLINAWAPSYTEKLAPFVEVYKTISKLYFALGNDEIRVSEDIRDCHERYFAVDRFAKEYNQISDKYQSASDDVIHAMGDELYEKRVNPDKYELKKAQLQEKIAKTKAQKKQILEQKKEALRKFIHARETYNTFKVRRLMHAFLLYSKALQETAEKEQELYGRAAEILKSMKEGGEVPEKVVEGIEQTMPSAEDNKELNETANAVAQQIGEAAQASQATAEAETAQKEQEPTPEQEAEADNAQKEQAEHQNSEEVPKKEEETTTQATEEVPQQQKQQAAEDESVFDASVFTQKEEENNEEVPSFTENSQTEFY